MENMLTVEEVAEILKVKPITVRQMYREKRLRAFKIGKSWRTTQSILEEDIACLSRGEKPPELPPQAAFGPTAKPGAKRGRKPRAPQESAPAAPAAVREEPVPAPAAEAPPVAVPAAPVMTEEAQDTSPAEDAAPKEKRRRPKAQETQDDEQPMLF